MPQLKVFGKRLIFSKSSIVDELVQSTLKIKNKKKQETSLLMDSTAFYIEKITT